MAAPAAATSRSVTTNVSQTNLPDTAPLPQSSAPPPPQQQPQQPQQQQQQSYPSLSSLSPPPPHTNFPQSQSPSKTSLTNWWKGFKSKPLFKKGDEPSEQQAPKGIFGVSLNESIRYAYVNISIKNPESGNSEIYGKIPTIVAKCGVYLKEKATDVEGIFRVSGSAKRIKELQAIFDSPPTYGKSLEWDGFNVHDAANVFRRYINHLPESIIPHDYYFAFRNPLKKEPRDTDEEIIKSYQRLIGDLPKLNGQILLYILDLLAVFAENADANLMPAANLAAIFQPGLLSHPDHDMNPNEYRASQEVLIFLIEHQERFLPTSVALQQQPPRAPSPMRKPIASTSQSQEPSAPARYQGNYPPKEIKPVNIPRRRTIPKKSDSPGFAGVGNVLRRHRSTRVQQSPKLAVEEQEPRRVSESSAPSSRHDDDGGDNLYMSQMAEEERETERDPALERGGGDVLSSPTSHSTEPYENGHIEDTIPTPKPTSNSFPNPMPTVITPSKEIDRAVPSVEECPMEEKTELPKPSNEPEGPLLGVTSTPMGRSSSYREELDEVIDYSEQTTSADNTEAEASDGAYKPVKSKKKRMSKLPWSKDSEASGSESKLSLSVPSLSKDSPKPSKKLQKKKRGKDGELQTPTSPAETPSSEVNPFERPRETLTPPPWTQHNNNSQQSLSASIPSRRSHISSARSSAEAPRTITPIDKRPASAAATTFEEMRLNAARNDGDLLTPGVIPAAREERARAGSQGSDHSASSAGKGGKIGAWLRKKRGFSVSSSTSAGGASSAVSD